METIEDIRKLPELTTDTIHIWGIHVPNVRDRLDALNAVLNKKEQEKAGRFRRESDRQSSIAARGALRVLLFGYTGIPAAELNFHYSETGKPHVMESKVDFNVSHSGDWVVLGVGLNRKIGVDVEKIKRELDVHAIANRYFSPEEISWIEQADDPHVIFFQLWARKEAYVKACGSALFRELSNFSVPLEDTEKDGWFFHRLKAGSNYAAAVVTDKRLVSVPCYDFGGLRWDS